MFTTILAFARRFTALAALVLATWGCTPVEALDDDTNGGTADDDTAVAGDGEDGNAGLAVTSITTIKTYGKSVDWLHSENRVATARPLWDAYYDLLVFDPDDPAAESYLTHGAPGAPQKHNGNPAWHPSGDHIVFTAENEDVVIEEADFVAIPGKGVNCNLWLAAADGSSFHQLTAHATAYDGSAPAVIHPQFSPDGGKVLWAERVGPLAGSLWGEWTLKVADIVIDNSGAHLDNVQTHAPGEQHAFYESHDFDATGRRVLFTGNLAEGQREVGMDIYQLDLQTGELLQLTDSWSDWDEHAHYSPDGSRIAWMSSTELDLEFPEQMGPHEWPDYLRTELWVMNADGSDKQRLTWFNDPDHPHYRAERVVVSDTTWGPHGDRLLALLALADADQGGNMTTELAMIELGSR